MTSDEAATMQIREVFAIKDTVRYPIAPDQTAADA